MVSVLSPLKIWTGISRVTSQHEGSNKMQRRKDGHHCKSPAPPPFPRLHVGKSDPRAFFWVLDSRGPGCGRGAGCCMGHSQQRGWRLPPPPRVSVPAPSQTPQRPQAVASQSSFEEDALKDLGPLQICKASSPTCLRW